MNYLKEIFNLIEERLILNLGVEYLLNSIILLPFEGHYSTVIFNPEGTLIDNYFKSNLIYIHDGLKNDGKIISIENSDDWKKEGVPYIVVYERDIYFS